MNPNASRKEKKVPASTKKAVITALNWILTIVCVVMVVFALVVAVFTIVRSANTDNLTKFGNKVYMNVASNSMEPTFNQNDVIIADYYDGDGKDLKVGMVITFHFTLPNGYNSYNTHRIVCILKDGDGNVTGIKTRGDNQEGSWKDSAVYENTYDGSATGPDGTWDSGTLRLKNNGKNMIVATWGKVDDEGNFTPGKRLKGVGAFANWIQDPEEYKIRFFCVVVLPLIILFILYAFMLVRAIIVAKLDSNRKRAQQPVTVDSLTEEEKKRLAMEYLASMQREALDGQGDAPVEGNADDVPAENAGEVPSEKNAESVPADENAEADGAAPAAVEEGNEAAETAAESEEAAPTEAEPNEAPEN